jgi:hypothetical protein
MLDIPEQRRISRRAPRLLVSCGLACLAVFFCLLGLSLRSFGGPADEITRRDYFIAGFKPPPRWELLPRDRPSYPQLLATASRGQGLERAVMTLVGKRLAPGTSLQQFAQEVLGLRNRPRIENLRTQLQSAFGWWGGQRVQVDATIAGDGENKRPQTMRQLLFMNPPYGYVLTLVAPQEQANARYRELDDTFGNLFPLSTAPVPDLFGTLPDGGNSAQSPAPNPIQAPMPTPMPPSPAPIR